MNLKRKNSKIHGQQVKLEYSFRKLTIRRISFVENSIRGLDEDETDFLARIDHARLEKQRELKRMEQEEIEELKISFFTRFFSIERIKKHFFSLTFLYKAQKEIETAATTAKSTTTKPHVAQPVVNKQKQLLSGIVKRKRYK